MTASNLCCTFLFPVTDVAASLQTWDSIASHQLISTERVIVCCRRPKARGVCCILTTSSIADHTVASKFCFCPSFFFQILTVVSIFSLSFSINLVFLCPYVKIGNVTDSVVYPPTGSTDNVWEINSWTLCLCPLWGTAFFTFYLTPKRSNIAGWNFQTKAILL